eukprot:1344891-Amorphochlora_amoeboformis.AAC.1
MGQARDREERGVGQTKDILAQVRDRVGQSGTGEGQSGTGEGQSGTDSGHRIRRLRRESRFWYVSVSYTHLRAHETDQYL